MFSKFCDSVADSVGKSASISRATEQSLQRSKGERLKRQFTAAKVQGSLQSGTEWKGKENQEIKNKLLTTALCQSLINLRKIYKNGKETPTTDTNGFKLVAKVPKTFAQYYTLDS